MDALLAPYEQQEFIPSHLIAPLLSFLFPECTISHTYSASHHVIKMQIKTLLGAPIGNWGMNRPADRMRCEDIAHYMGISKKPVDTMIYASWNNKQKRCDMLDGIHRYTALALLKEKSSHVDFISSEFGDLSWLWESFIFVNIRVNATEGEKIELFKSLNKSNPVPDLYVRDTAKDKRECIEALALDWTTRYKTHFSSSNKPNRPHINRDRFIDVLSDAYDKMNLTEETKMRLGQTLERTNQHISQNVPKKVTPNALQKCEETGCWLFLYTAEQLVQML